MVNSKFFVYVSERFRCPDCQRSNFKSVDSALQHIEIEHPERKLPKNEALRKYLLTYRRPKKPKQKLVKCKRCRKNETKKGEVYCAPCNPNTKRKCCFKISNKKGQCQENGEHKFSVRDALNTPRTKIRLVFPNQRKTTMRLCSEHYDFVSTRIAWMKADREGSKFQMWYESIPKKAEAVRGKKLFEHTVPAGPKKKMGKLKRKAMPNRTKRKAKGKAEVEKAQQEFMDGTSSRRNLDEVRKTRNLSDRVARKCYGIHPHCSICGECHTNRRSHARGHPSR